MFALLGLRHLYFLADGLLRRLAHLSAGLAVMLAFVGVKLLTEALSESGIPRVWPLPVAHISTSMSLAVIAATTATSLTVGHRRGQSRAAPEHTAHQAGGGLPQAPCRSAPSRATSREPPADR